MPEKAQKSIIGASLRGALLGALVGAIVIVPAIIWETRFLSWDIVAISVVASTFVGALVGGASCYARMI